MFAGERAAADMCVLDGRQAMNIVRQYYDVDHEAGACNDYEYLLAVAWNGKGNSLEAFLAMWDTTLAGMPEQDDITLNTLFHRQCKKSAHALTYDLQVYERMPVGQRTYEVLRGYVVRYLTKAREPESCTYRWCF